jgi:diguanylate cyclase (GGDEF)-like protein
MTDERLEARVLVVDDTPTNLDLVRQALESIGCEVMVATSGERALETVQRQVPELILLDVVLPGMDGFEVCRRLGRDETTRAIPVIFLTARDAADDIVEGFRAGADYIVKPFRKEEVLARVRTQVERVRLLREVVAKNAELELLRLRLAERQASHSFQDAASGLYHRAGFAALARQQLKVARRTRTEMILLRADVEGETLEQIERALGELGRVVQRTFRDADMAGRMNGTDCGVLLVNAGAGQTDIALRRLERNLAAHNARAGEGQKLQVRVGVAYFDPGRPCSFEELVAAADAEMPIGGAATRPRDAG